MVTIRALLRGLPAIGCLAWFDGESFYLQAHDNEVAIGKDKAGTYYYSSDWMHLDACARIVDCSVLLSAGDTIRFNIKSHKYDILPSFVPPMQHLMELTKKGNKTKKTKKTKKRGKWWLNDFERKAANTDPFYYDDTAEKWAGVDGWEEYAKQYD